MKPERVQKLLAAAGVASRRACEDYIRAGRVAVNGRTVRIGATATRDDTIMVDGKKVMFEQAVYIVLHKPAGVTSTVKDPHAKKTIVELVDVKQRVFPVGRLDKETEGLILLTNDGPLMNKLLHPRFGVTKTYEAITKDKINKRLIERMRKGINVEGRKVHVTSATLLRKNKMRITIHEGRKRIVRKLFASAGHTIERLVRVSFGPLRLGALRPGRWRRLTEAEVAKLKREPKEKPQKRVYK